MKVMATVFMHEVGRSLPGWAEKFVNEEGRSISLLRIVLKKGVKSCEETICRK